VVTANYIVRRKGTGRAERGVGGGDVGMLKFMMKSSKEKINLEIAKTKTVKFRPHKFLI
jgi:hypothetical protein